MPVETSEKALLTHMDETDEHHALAHIMPREGTVAARTAASGGCISFFKVLEFCYSFSSNSINLELKVLGVTVASATLNPAHPCAKLGGKVDGVKAELDVCFNFSSMCMEIKGEACLPFVGCKSFSKEICF